MYETLMLGLQNYWNDTGRCVPHHITMALEKYFLEMPGGVSQFVTLGEGCAPLTRENRCGFDARYGCFMYYFLWAYIAAALGYMSVILMLVSTFACSAIAIYNMIRAVTFIEYRPRRAHMPAGCPWLLVGALAVGVTCTHFAKKGEYVMLTSHVIIIVLAMIAMAFMVY